ncbi:MAG: class I SAM-dependent methyltransferase [Bacteroidota bacterium]
MASPYSLLAAGYDAVMAHVDYPMWAGYVRGVLRQHAPEAETVVELGCGTGAFAVALQPQGPPPRGYVYRAYDGSEAMVERARETVRHAGRAVEVSVADFRDPVPGPPADAVLLLYDGLNYLTEPADVATLLRHVHAALVPGGVAILDQSTPANSLNHAADFDDAGETDAFRYLRTSRYDAEARLHTTHFRLTLPDGTEAAETHVQRAYRLDEVGALAEAVGFGIEAAYDGFTTAPASETTERVHWVLRRPRTEAERP